MLSPERRRLHQLFVSRGEKNPGRLWTLHGVRILTSDGFRPLARVMARTRSEARAAFKRILGVPRLPAGLTPQPA